MPSMSIFLYFILVAATIATFNDPAAYIATEPNRLSNGDFSRGLQDWNPVGPGISFRGSGMACLTTASADAETVLSQQVSTNPQERLIRITGRYRTQNVIGGDRHWKTASVSILATDAQDRPQHQFSHQLTDADTDSKWQKFDRLYVIHPTVSKLYVAIQILQASGTICVTDISAVPVTLDQRFARIRTAFLFIWPAILAWVLSPWVRQMASRRAGMIPLALALSILLSTLVPGPVVHGFAERILPAEFAPQNAIVTLVDAQPFNLTPLPRKLDAFKIGHAALFALLQFSLMHIRIRTDRIRYNVTAVAVLAIATEVLQLYSIDRTPRLADIVVDMTGALIGLMLALLFTPFKRRREPT